MDITIDTLTETQKQIAIQRLTAMWAFMECGLGGMLHVFQMPFTGLVVGGLAIIIITLIAHFSDCSFNTMIKSMIIVLIIKVTISPYTPFPAYIAVTFQSLLGAGLFKLFRVNYFSVFVLSILSMIESAIQKIIVLTIFFGQSIWKAADAFSKFVANLFHHKGFDGILYLMVIYFAIYIIGGIIVALLAIKTVRGIFNTNERYILSAEITNSTDLLKSTSKKKRIYSLMIIMCLISATLLIFNKDKTNTLGTIINVFCWTFTAIIIWYYILTPLFTKFILELLKNKKNKYSNEVASVMYSLPELKSITQAAWTKSKDEIGFKRLSVFLHYLINWSLTYTEK